MALLVLSGCGSSKGSSSESNSEEGKKETFKIGITQFVAHPSLDEALKGFQQAIKDKGLNVDYDIQNAQGDQSNTQTIANNFVGDNVDLIFANATPSALAAANATKDIPIVFTSVTDPVGAGL